MNYLLKRKAELEAKLNKYGEEARSADLTDEQVKTITDAVEKIKAELEELNKAITDADATGDEPDDDDDNPKDPTPAPAPGDDNKGDETKGKVVSSESRAALRAAIKPNITIPAKENAERRDGKTRELFTKAALGQNIDQAEARDFGIITGKGGLTVPKTIEKEIISYAQEENGLRQFGTVHSDSNTNGYPVLVKAPTANGHKVERTIANPIPDSAIELEERVLDPTEFDALVTFTKKLANRSGINIENEVITELSKAYTAKEADYMFNGLDTDNANDGSLLKQAVEYAPAAAVDLTTGSAVSDALVHFKNSVKSSVRKNSMFFLNTAAQDLIETAKDANGRPLYRPLDALENGQIAGVDGRLLGYNAHVTDYLFADDKQDESVPAFYFGDFKSFQIQDVLGSMELQVLNELYSASNLIGAKIYNLLDGQLIFSPLEPTMYKLNLAGKPAEG